MKKMTTIGMMIFMLSMSLPVMGAMSISKMRQNARFLTDKMTYELKLSMMQYDDVYEVNYDFINNIRYIMDDVVRGYGYAVERYYEYLDIRNDDLRWILTNSQYRRFMDVDYFYRPIYTTQNNWLFRIYKTYLDKNLFHYGKPHHYKSYKGEHYRVHHNHVSFYKSNHKNKYNHSVYKGDVKVKRNPVTKPSANPSNKRKDTNVEKKNDKKNVHSNNNRRENVQRKDKPAVSSNKAKVETSSRKSAEVKADNRNARRTATSNGKRSTRSSSGSRREAKERK
jgi:hypothetical protein